MENATKALEIASGVLIALMVLGLVVIAYNRLANEKREEYEVTAIEQATNFNVEYEYYNKQGLYGTELLSLANKMENYNKKYNESEGYQRIEMTVSLKAMVGNIKYFTAGSGLSSSDLTSRYASLTKDINKTGKTILTSRETNEKKTIAEWSKLNSGTINAKLSSSDIEKINAYRDLVDEQTGVARKTFNCTKVEYDKSNGKITKMTFEDTSK